MYESARGGARGVGGSAAAAEAAPEGREVAEMDGGLGEGEVREIEASAVKIPRPTRKWGRPLNSESPVKREGGGHKRTVSRFMSALVVLIGWEVLF